MDKQRNNTEHKISDNQTNESTLEEILLAADILSRLPEGKSLNRILFTEIARLVTSPIIEFVPLKIIDNKINVLLIPRDADDPLWPSMLHTPGTAVRPLDNNIEEPFKRLLNGELGDVDLSSLNYAGMQLHHTDRGNELAHIFYGEVDGVSSGTYYPVDALPNNIIASQLSMIKAVVGEYATSKNIPIPELSYPKASIIKLSPSI